MPYSNTYITDLNAIIDDISNNRLTGSGQAVEKFRAFLTSVKNIGRYSLANWPNSFVQRVWSFGKLFSSNDPLPFINLLETEINNSTLEEKEILQFFRIEILWNFEKAENLEEELVTLTSVYRTNPELLHTLGHVQARNKRFNEALNSYNHAITINNCPEYLESKFRIEVQYVDHLLEIDDYNKASTMVNEILNSEIYKSDFVKNNWFVFLNNRIKDYELSEKKLLNKENEIMNLVQNKFETERRKIIELIGLFTAIITFIFTTVNVGKNFNFSQALVFIICLGLILIGFTTTISILFKSGSKKVYNDVRLYVILFIGFMLYFIISFTASLSEFMKYLT